MFRFPMKLAASLLVAGALAACAAPQPQERPDPTPVRPEGLAAAGLHVEAAEAWLQIAERNPNRRFEARLAASGQWLAAGRTDLARAALEPIDESGLDDADAVALRLMRAEIALLDNRLVDARRLLSIPDQRLSDGLAPRHRSLRERLLEIDPDSPDARLEALERAVGEPGFGPDRALALLIELPLRDLLALRESNRAQPLVHPWLDLAVSARRRLIDDPALVRELDHWRIRHGLPETTALEAAEWIAAWRETLPMPETIAVLLPGEGALARAGNALRDGMLSRWLEIPPERRPALDFRYLDQTPDAARSEFFDVRDTGAEFVIGPVWREQIDPLLSLPDPVVPLLLLNRPVDPTRTPDAADPVAVLALPPEEEAELAAVRALVDSHERALVVAQDSDFGRRVAGRFVETFELGGGRVLAQTFYTPGEFDHTELLSTLLELDRSEQRIARLRSVLGEDFEAVPQRRTDFDVVFLAARGGDGLQIVPQLRFFELKDTPLLATSNIYPGGDIGSDLDGVQFPIAPWSLNSGRSAELRRDVVARVPELASSTTLSVLYALGRDAMSLVPWFASMKADSELYLAGHVGRLRLADGVFLERDLPWARIVDGQPVRDDPAL